MGRPQHLQFRRGCTPARVACMLANTPRRCMLNPPLSEPVRRGHTPRGAGAWLALPGLLLSGSCFFDLPALETDGGIGGSGGLSGLGGDGQPAGNTGDPGGSSGLGGAAGGVGSTCGFGEKLCGETCRPIEDPAFGCSSTSCEPCLNASGGVMGCDNGQCVVARCQENFADCDGDASNGCEYPLGPVAPSVTSLDVPFAEILVDGKREDWSSVPAYAFESVCTDCAEDNNTPPITADSTRPPLADLDARFRVAWNGDFFYIFLEAFDDHPFDAGVPGSTRCQHGAECEDALQVFFDGRNDRLLNDQGYGFDNSRLFLGLSNRFAAPAQGPPQLGDVEIVTQRQGSRCYRLEAKIDWVYIAATRGGGTAEGQFPPKAGQSYGFDIAINDWDPAISDATRLERQSQIFWVDPGPNYFNKPTGIGPMTLSGGLDAGP